VVRRSVLEVSSRKDRIHASERLCPIDHKAVGYLSKGERRRRANEIVEASGVNDAQQFIETNTGVTFREQAKWFLNHAVNRKRNPVKPATSTTWQNCVAKWFNPSLGDLPLTSVNNQTVKTLVAKMHAIGMSPKTISNYVGLVKLVVASAIGDDGEELFPRKWNHEFLDFPMVSAIVEKAAGQEQVLYALLAGTGLRVGEALGLEVRHVSADCRTITIEQSCWAGKLQSPKTKNAYRQVDLCSALAELLKVFLGERSSGLVFSNRAGKPLSQTNLARRSLHPILKESKAEKTGFHAMRRFRATWLRKQLAPEDLIQFWLGHAQQTQTDGYSKLGEDVEFRRQVAETVATGFVIPKSVRPMRPKKSKQIQLEVAA
jgi:integrase